MIELQVQGTTVLRAGTGGDFQSRRSAAVRLLRGRFGDGALAHSCPECDHCDHGAPSWSSYPGNISISYTRDSVAVAYDDSRRVGIDIEEIAPPPPRAFRVLSPSEASFLADLHGRDASLAYTRLWCAKEAYTKAIGVGMAIPFASLSFAPLITGCSDPRVTELYLGGPVGMLAVLDN